MVDTPAASDALTSGDGKKSKGGIKAFIRKNKTLTAVAGLGGLYFIWKMRQEHAEVTPAGEAGELTSEGQGLIQSGQLEQYETGRAERAEERAESDTAEIEDELRREKEKNKEEKEEKEEKGSPEPKETPEPAPSATPAGTGVSLHGKNFPGATGSHVAKTGQTTGGKKYVEYAIQFPGRIEHWQYFTDTGNWRQVRGSSGAAGGQNKTGTATGGSTGGQAGKSTGGAGGTSGGGSGAGGSTGGGSTSHPPPKVKIGVAPAVPVVVAKPVAVNSSGGPPQNNSQHPQAVNTGNRAVNGGVGGHKAPPGYHLFVQGGYIWRAPNA
jgi:hypothetical protein